MTRRLAMLAALSTLLSGCVFRWTIQQRSTDEESDESQSNRPPPPQRPPVRR